MTATRLARGPNTVVGTALGWAYLVAGVVAAAVALGAEMAAESPEAVSSTERVMAYALLGAVLLVAASLGLAKSANTVLGALYLVVGVVLLFTAGADSQLLALNHPDQVVHLSSAALLLGLGRTQD